MYNKYPGPPMFVMKRAPFILLFAMWSSLLLLPIGATLTFQSPIIQERQNPAFTISVSQNAPSGLDIVDKGMHLESKLTSNCVAIDGWLGGLPCAVSCFIHRHGSVDLIICCSILANSLLNRLPGLCNVRPFFPGIHRNKSQPKCVQPQLVAINIRPNWEACAHSSRRHVRRLC